MTKGDFEHPKNRLVKMRVFLRELQRKYDLSDNALQHIIEIVQNRLRILKSFSLFLSDMIKKQDC